MDGSLASAEVPQPSNRPLDRLADAPEEPREGSAGADRDWLRSLVTQLAIVVLSVGAVNAVRPIVTYRALDLGAGPFEIGLVQSAFSILPAATAVAIGRLVDRRGEARFLAGAMAVLAVASLVTATADSLPVLAAAMTLLGLGQITSHVAGQTMIANRGPREQRELRYGWYATCASLGQLVGPAVAALVLGSSIAAGVAEPGRSSVDARAVIGSTGNPQAPVFLVGAGMAAAAFVLALTIPHRRPRSRPTSEVEASVGLARAAWLVVRRPGMATAMLVSITVLSSVDVLVAYLPAYGEAVGLSVETVGLLLSVRAGASLASRLLMGVLIDRLGRERLLATSMILAALGVGALILVPPTPILVALMIAAGLGLGLGQPMTIAWVANRSPRRERALALGVRLTGNRASLLVVPTAVGALAGATGLTSIWLVVAGFLALGAIAALRTPFDAVVDRRAAAE
ncbi:MAG TPA: MFS transporter [Candidatus Binatia bacterium]|nr:MFS transporter [Candidatus Binatia bacterium]